MSLKFAYYPGCASKEITRESSDTTLKVAPLLDIELKEMPKANCCGAGLLKDYDYKLHLAMNARIFAEAEGMGLDIMTICSTCLMVMSTANSELKNDEKLLAETNELLGEAGLTYKGTIDIKHFLWVVMKEVGAEKLKGLVKRPLKGIRLASFYGCHTLRPSSVLGFDDPLNPTSMEEITAALGAESVDYDGRTKCCGFQADLVTEEVALAMTAKRLLSAKDSGAHSVVTPCPFCHINLDSYQSKAERVAGRKIDIPVLHFTQALGIALGLSSKDMGLDRHMVPLQDLLDSI
ncbi:MAG: CoB--CoM heterodisulfide reductase iron-sulfur subunit B family protein [Deltaproteobacteria bacterium]|nr:CoB--CoM heterodisulfide reductase iron-sulfur subunit B family protein [Deltaproteobacteria bacterium]